MSGLEEWWSFPIKSKSVSLDGESPLPSFKNKQNRNMPIFLDYRQEVYEEFLVVNSTYLLSKISQGED